MWSKRRIITNVKGNIKEYEGKSDYPQESLSVLRSAAIDWSGAFIRSFVQCKLVLSYRRRNFVERISEVHREFYWTFLGWRFFLRAFFQNYIVRFQFILHLFNFMHFFHFYLHEWRFYSALSSRLWWSQNTKNDPILDTNK